MGEVVNQNEFVPTQKETTAVTEMLQSRQIQEVQASLVMAKRFPRDQFESYNRIMNACKRKGLAEKAIYSYPRGGQAIQGPSIRLAEAIAQNWGNIDCGVVELEQKNGESQAMAYAWDKETNTRFEKIFTVKHVRDTKQGQRPLTDARDIYEVVASQGSRRMRSCILSVLPGDILESAVNECRETLKRADNDKPLEERLRAMIQAFDEKYRIPKMLIEKYIGYSIEKMTEDDLVNLRGVYTALKDGAAKREDYFDIKTEAPDPLKGGAPDANK